jgi:manganese transport protein
MVLSIQLPFTVFLQVSLTSSKKVMGKYANSRGNAIFLYSLAAIVTLLNVWLLVDSL